ncbi:metal-dependent phosphohydrolase, hd subdomain [hydrocarbon metagenome]|uniref:Metal-dependent phosphohydrolase, hd subdomain n=1 Tax=hydrocarbon metagenome TaxID=938273 RepID=A0A0W8FYZ5_9ZZZZ
MAEKLIEKAIKYVNNLFEEKANGNYTYHNLAHTAAVAKTADIIGKAENLSPEDLEIVVLAAWFHDVGYFSNPDTHEEEGAKLAEEFLIEENFQREKINKIKSCILATTVPQRPKNLLEEILCDADLHHLGSDNFSARNELYRIELEKTKGIRFNNAGWLQHNIDFFTQHKYFTHYALENFDKKKSENLLNLQIN